MASMSAEELADYVNRYNENANATYKDNLEKIGIIDNNNPETIHFMPLLSKIRKLWKDLISDYNKKSKRISISLEVIRYTDTVGLMMSSVTTMINAVTYILIGFVAISLIVSSIMIGIITYISVLERTKEIGVLRAMGASKRDVTRIFTAETIIEGAIAGVLWNLDYPFTKYCDYTYCEKLAEYQSYLFPTYLVSNCSHCYFYLTHRLCRHSAITCSS